MRESGRRKCGDIMVRTAEEHKEEIIQNMRAVGTYKDSFMNTINAYARAMQDYDNVCESFEKLGSKFMVKHTNKAGADNIVKNNYQYAAQPQVQPQVQYATQQQVQPQVQVQQQQLHTQEEQ